MILDSMYIFNHEHRSHVGRHTPTAAQNKATEGAAHISVIW
jgi:hypothetical protein